MTKKILSGIFCILILLTTAVVSYSAGIARMPKTGQTASYGTSDDGALQKGAAWPATRFKDNGNGTVTDRLTGLIWLKNANCFATQAWAAALNSANMLANASCGLSDGSVIGDWRLPNVNELESLIDASNFSPALPTGHPFLSVQSYGYWSSTMYVPSPLNAWSVNMTEGSVLYMTKTSPYYVWPVRGGQ